MNDETSAPKVEIVGTALAISLKALVFIDCLACMSVRGIKELSRRSSRSHPGVVQNLTRSSLGSVIAGVVLLRTIGYSI